MNAQGFFSAISRQPTQMDFPKYWVIGKNSLSYGKIFRILCKTRKKGGLRPPFLLAPAPWFTVPSLTCWRIASIFLGAFSIFGKINFFCQNWVFQDFSTYRSEEKLQFLSKLKIFIGLINRSQVYGLKWRAIFPDLLLHCAKFKNEPLCRFQFSGSRSG